MLFQQQTAPSGWTKVTSGINNHALRVTTGNPAIVSNQQSFSNVFTTVPVSGSVDETILNINQMPSHSHGVTEPQIPGKANAGHVHKSNSDFTFTYDKFQKDSGGSFAVANAAAVLEDTSADESDVSVQSNGGSVGHDHGFSGTNINLSINYVDVIVAQKD